MLRLKIRCLLMPGSSESLRGVRHPQESFLRMTSSMPGVSEAPLWSTLRGQEVCRRLDQEETVICLRRAHPCRRMGRECVEAGLG